MVEICNINIEDIFINAKDKLKDKFDDNGIVNPRIIKYIIDDGRFSDLNWVENIMVEYWLHHVVKMEEMRGGYFI